MCVCVCVCVCVAVTQLLTPQENPALLFVIKQRSPISPIICNLIRNLVHPSIYIFEMKSKHPASGCATTQHAQLQLSEHCLLRSFVTIKINV